MRVPRSRGAICGTLIVILGAWVAIVPFVGPLFSYSVGSSTAWDWTIGRLWLNVLPGAVAILAGLALAGGFRRMSLAVASWVAVIAGGWIVVGPTVSRVWNDGLAQSGQPAGDTNMQVLELLGFSLLSGALIAVLGAFGLGRASLVAADNVAVREVDRGPYRAEPTEDVTAAPVATAAPGRPEAREPERRSERGSESRFGGFHIGGHPHPSR